MNVKRFSIGYRSLKDADSKNNLNSFRVSRDYFLSGDIDHLLIRTKSLILRNEAAIFSFALL